MQMRDEHRVEPTDRCRVHRRADTPQVRDPAAEDGIGEHTRAVQLQQDRAVADPGDSGALGRVGCESSCCGTAPSTSTEPNHRIRFGRHGRHPDRTKATPAPANGSPRADARATTGA